MTENQADKIMEFLANLLSRQVGRKPEPVDDCFVPLYTCPNCGKRIIPISIENGNLNGDYCKWCGQKLDWSDNNA